MSFHISEVELCDIEEFATVDTLAMADSPVAAAVELAVRKNGQGSRYNRLVELLRKGLENKNPNGVWLKATDSETGRIVAGAAWTWHLEETFVDRPPRATTDGPQEETIFTAFGADWQAFRKEYFAEGKWYHLQTLFTHPDWQKRGLGTMLVKYGCQKADEVGVVCTLIATEAGHNLYLKNGFEVVRERSFDLRPFGVDATELRRWMVRKARS